MASFARLTVRLLLVTVAPLFALGARAEQAHLTVAVVAAGTGWRFDSVQSSTGDPALTAIVLGSLVPATFGRDWRAGGDFLLIDGREWTWLKQRLVQRALGSPSVKAKRTGDNTFVLIVSATVPPNGPKRGISLVIQSWGVTTAMDVDTSTFGAAMARRREEESSGVALDPTSFSRLWLNSTIRIEPKPARPATGANPEPAERLRDQSLKLLESVCAAYSADLRPGVGYEKLNHAIRTSLARIIGGSDPRGETTESINNDLLCVTVYDVDPVLGVDVEVSTIELPADLGGRMSLAEFATKYGNGPFGRRLLDTIEPLETELTQRLGLPPATFPRFMPDPDRAALCALLARDPRVSAVGIRRDESGRLVFDVVYRPRQSHLSLTAKGDSIRSLEGSFSWDTSWANGRSVGATAEYGATSRSGSLTYSHRTWQISDNSDAKFGAEASWAEQPNARLGNPSGPLVRRGDGNAGVRVRFETSRTATRHDAGDPGSQRRWFYNASLFAGARSLDGRAPAGFLGSAPDHLAGPSVTQVQAFEIQDTPAAAPTEGTSPGRPHAPHLRRLQFRAGAKLQCDAFLPQHYADYLRGRLDAFAHRDLGTPVHTDGYLETRWSAGAMSQAAPRLDFWRFGGQDLLVGLEEGELAGRNMWAGALENGWSVTSLLPSHAASGDAPPQAPAAATPPSSVLDGLFVFALAECGEVRGHDSAGPWFAPRHFATSYAVGVRLNGLVPGAAGDTAITLGYGWSPQSVHRAGRLFARVIFHLGQ